MSSLNENFKIKKGLTVNTTISAGSCVEADSFVKHDGTSSQFLKADGSVDSATYTTCLGDITNVSTSTDYMTGGGASGSVEIGIDSACTNKWDNAASGGVQSLSAGDGLLDNGTATDPNIAVDSTVVRTSGAQSIAGVKSFSDDLVVDTDTLFVDVSTDQVGINTNTPGEALDVIGNVQVTDGEFIGDLRGAVHFKAQAGENISEGEAVYISGISGNTTVVSLADADDASKMPAFGIATETATSGNPITVGNFGALANLNTTQWGAEGDELFVDTTAGQLISAAPTGESAAIQKIAKITRAHASSGSITIMGAGRSNAVPNLDNGDIFIGNGSNQAVTASLQTCTEAIGDAKYTQGVTTTGEYLTGGGTTGCFNIGIDSACGAKWDTAAAGDISEVIAGTNLTGGGTSGSVTLNMDTGGIGAGTYGSTDDNTKIDTITVDAYGRVTAVACGNTGDINSICTNAGSLLSGGGGSGTLCLGIDSGALTPFDQSACPGIDCTGTTTASNSQTFTNKAGNISQWTNDSGYTTCTGTVVSGDISSFTSCQGTTTPSNTQTFTNKSGNISQWTNDSGYTTCLGDITGVTAGNGLSGGGTSGTATLALDGDALTALNQSACAGINCVGTTTASNTQTFTNKSGNISQWTNDSGYTTCTGDVTGIDAGTAITISDGTTSTPSVAVTSACNTAWNSAKSIADGLAGCAGLACVGDITAVTTGPYLTGGATSGSAEVGIDSACTNKWDAAAAGGVTSLSAGDGLLDNGTATDPNIAVDSTVVRTAGTQTVGGLKTFSDAVCITGGDTTTDAFCISNTDNDTAAAPIQTFKRNSNTPAGGDYLGQLKFKGVNDNSQEVVYSKITSKINDEQGGIERGLFETAVQKSGTMTIVARQTDTDLKLINGTGLEVDGNILSAGSNLNSLFSNCQGTITGVTAGAGLSGGATSGTATVALDGAMVATLNQSGCAGLNCVGTIAGFDTGSDGITIDDGDPSAVILDVDSSVVRTTGNQTLGGNKCFTGNILSAGVNLDQLFGSGGGGVDAGTACKLTKYNAAGDNVEDSIVTEGSSLITIAGALDVDNICSNDASNNICYGLNVGGGGIANTSIGCCAANAMTTGFNNVAIGPAAMKLANGICRNIAIGVNAAEDLASGGDDNVAIGSNAMSNGTTITDSVAIGNCAMGSGATTGDCNVSIGFETMMNAVGACNNTAIGSQSMRAIVSGEFNTAQGFKSLCSIVGGDRNTAIGAVAGQSITSGCDNTAIGFRALCGAVTGCNNVAMGRQAMKAVVTGSDNVGIGQDAMTTNTAGCCNVAIGQEAMCGNTEGSYNVSIGQQSMRYALSGDHNMALGQYALYDNWGGDYNTAVGTAAMQCNTTGSNNAALGYRAMFNNTTGNDNFAVGECALQSNVNGIGNTAVGHNAFGCNVTGNYTVALGDNAGSLYADGCTALSASSDSIYIGRDTRGKNSSDSNSIVIGYNACSCGQNTIKMGNGSITAACIQVAWTTVSDERDKTCIEDLNKGLEFIGDLKPKSFEYREDRSTTKGTGVKRYGFLAQDVLAAEGEDNVIVSENNEDQLGLNSDYLVPILVKAVQELEARVAELEGN